MACAGLLAVCLLGPPAPQPPRHPVPAAGHALFQDVSRAPVGGCRAPHVSVLCPCLPPHLLALLRSLSQIICDPAVLVPLPLCSLYCLCAAPCLLVSTIVLLSTPNFPSGARAVNTQSQQPCPTCSIAAPAGLMGPGGLDLGALSCPRSFRPDPRVAELHSW